MFSIASKECWDKIGRNLFPRDWKGTKACYRTLAALLLLLLFILGWVAYGAWNH